MTDTTNSTEQAGVTTSAQDMEEYSLKQKVAAVIALLVVLAVAAAGIVFYIQSRDDKPKPPAHGYTLTPPAGWEKLKDSPQGSSVVFADPQGETDTTGELKPFIAVQSSPLNEEGQKAGFAKVSKQFQDRMADTYANFQIISSENKDIAGTPALLMTFSFTQDGAAITARSLFTVKYGISYVVNGESLTSTWPQHIEEIEKSLQTFRP